MTIPARKPRLADYFFFLKIPSYTLNTLGMTMMTFAIGGLAYWMPAYLKQREKLASLHSTGETIDLFGIEAVTLFGGITALAGRSRPSREVSPAIGRGNIIPAASFLVSGLRF